MACRRKRARLARSIGRSWRPLPGSTWDRISSSTRSFRRRIRIGARPARGPIGPHCEDLIGSADPVSVPCREEPVARREPCAHGRWESPTPLQRGGQEGFSERTREGDALFRLPSRKSLQFPRPAEPEPPPAESRPSETAGLSGILPSPFEVVGSRNPANSALTLALSRRKNLMLPSSPALRRRPRRALRLMRLRSCRSARGLRRHEEALMRRYPGDGRLLDGRQLFERRSSRSRRSNARATPTPQAPPFVRGIVNLRGAVVPVVGSGTFSACRGPDRPNKPYLMIANAAGLTMGVIVDGISRVITISSESLEEYQEGPRLQVRGGRPTGKSSRRIRS